MNTYFYDDLGFDGEDQCFMRPRLPSEPCRECALSVADRCLNCIDEPQKTARAVAQWEALVRSRRIEDERKARARQVRDIAEKLRSLQIELAALVEEEANMSYVHYLVVRATRAAAAASRREVDTEPA